MSKIQDQIKALQQKQKKLDYLSYISDLLKNDKHCLDFKEIKEEVLGLMDPVILNIMETIENDGGKSEKSSVIPVNVELTGDEKSVLKAIAQEAAKRLNIGASPKSEKVEPGGNLFTKTESSTVPSLSLNSNVKPPNRSTHEKMTFALDNRHLGGKRVNVSNDRNVKIEGTVVGLDAPFIIVKTDTGPTIEVPIEQVSLV